MREKSTSSNAQAGEAPEASDAISEKKVTTDEDVVEIQSSPKNKSKSKISPKIGHGENPNPLPHEGLQPSGLDEEAPPRPVMEEDWDDDYRECHEYGPILQLVEAGGKDWPQGLFI